MGIVLMLLVGSFVSAQCMWGGFRGRGGPCRGGGGFHHKHHGPTAADLNPATTTKPGWLLHRACLAKNLETVNALLERADIAAFINHVINGMTPLDIALNDLNIALRDLIVAQGGLEASTIPAPAPAAAEDAAPKAPKSPCGFKGSFMKGILEKNPATTLEPGKFLRMACLINDLEKVQAILERADVATFINQVGKRGKTALDIANHHANEQIKELLTNAGAVCAPKSAGFNHHHGHRGHYNRGGHRSGHGHCHKKWK